MKTIKELVQALAQGSKPVVTFAAGIGDKESYAEAGMRARIVRASGPDRDGVLKIWFDFEEFAGHNKGFESANYYDKAGKPTLTAREAGFYKPTEEIYFDSSEELVSLMSLEQGGVELFEEYKAQGCEGTYVQWLERKLLEARGGGAG